MIYFTKPSIHYLLMIFGLILCVFVLSGCLKEEQNIQIVEVNSAKVQCTGVGPKQCLQIKFEGSQTWENLYQEIEGFDFKPGYISKLRITVDDLDPKALPADASSKKYTLINILSKEIDPLITLNDIWALEQLYDENIKQLKNTPYMEININNKIIMGIDGCNNYRANIEFIDPEAISFGVMLGTKKMCIHDNISQKFIKAMQEVRFYRKVEKNLLFLNSKKDTILYFKKTD